MRLLPPGVVFLHGGHNDVAVLWDLNLQHYIIPFYHVSAVDRLVFHKHYGNTNVRELVEQESPTNINFIDQKNVV